MSTPAPEPPRPLAAAAPPWSESLYATLRSLAARHLRGERPGSTLQPTALVHEAWLRLRAGAPVEWEGRGHLLAVAARQLRLILVQHARTRNARKRGGDWGRVTLAGLESGSEEPEGQVDALDLEEALVALEREEPDWVRVVELRYFGGLSELEIAAELGVTDRTVRRRWEGARAWLARELRRGLDR